MKTTLQVCSIALFATLVAGCGKESSDTAKTPAPAAEEAADLNTLVNAGVAAIAQKDAAAATDAAEKAQALQPESAEACLVAGQAACLRQDFEQGRTQAWARSNSCSITPMSRALCFCRRVG